jgi:hypothetical protein
MSASASEARLDTCRIRLHAAAYKGRRLYYGYRTGPYVLPESISPIKSESSQPEQRMLDIAGIMEVQRWGDEEGFEAAVHTEEGPKSLKGTVVRRWSSNDIQSGAIPRWQVSFREADQAIRNAYDTLTPKEAIQVISTIWEQLDRTSELAAARSRLLAGKLCKPKMVPLPKWFEDQRAKLHATDEGDIAANPLAVTSAELLVRAALAGIPDSCGVEAELETGPMGRVIIDWRVPEKRLQWMVEPLDIPWPSVKVYQVSHEPYATSIDALETRVYYNAFDAVESFVRFVDGN